MRCFLVKISRCYNDTLSHKGEGEILLRPRFILMRMGLGPATPDFADPNKEDVVGRPEPVLGRADGPTRGPAMTRGQRPASLSLCGLV